MQSDTVADRVSAARDRRDQERNKESANKPTYNDEQKKLAQQYSSVAQMTGGIPVSLADRKFFTVNTAPRKLNPNIDMRATDEEIKVAKYYYEKAIADGATKEDKQNWKDIKNYIANRAAEREAERLTDKSDESKTGLYSLSAPAVQNIKKETPPIVDKAALAFNAGISEGIAAPIKAIGTITGNTRLRDNAFVIANQLEQQESGKLEKLALSAVESIGRMLPSQLVGMATDPIAASAIMGLGSAQSAFEDAIKDGATQGKALVYAGLVGAAEGTLSYFLGGIPGIKRGSTGTLKTLASEGLEGVAKQTVNKVAPKLVSSLDNVLAKVIKSPVIRKALESYVSNVGSEAFEETVQSVFDNALQKWLLGNEDTKLVSMETLESGLLGGIIAAVMGVPNVSVELSSANTDAAKTAAEEAAAVSNVETVSTPETVEQPTARPKITEETLQAALDDAAKVKTTSNKGVQAVKRMYVDGEITAREISEIMSSPEARAAFDLYFETEIKNGKIGDIRRQVKEVATQRKAELESNPSARIVAKVEAGTATAAEIMADEANIEALRAEYERLEAKVRAAEETDPDIGNWYRQTADGNRILNIGLQFFGGFGDMHKVGFTPKMNADLPVAEKTPETTATTAQTSETAQPKVTNAATETASTEPVKASDNTTEEKPYKRPKGTMKFGETAINSKTLSSEAVAELKKRYESGENFTYDKEINEEQKTQAEQMFNDYTDGGKDISGAVRHAKALVNENRPLTGKEGAFLVYAINRANAAGDVQAAADIVEQAAYIGRSYGQFIQSLSMIAKLSPEGMLVATKREAAKYDARVKEAAKNKPQTLKDKKDTERKIQKKQKELEEVRSKLFENKDITDEVTKELETLEEQLEAYKDIAKYRKKINNAEAEIGKLSAEEKAQRIAELQAEIDALNDISSLENRVKYYQKVLGKLSPEEYAFWAQEMRKQISDYRDINRKSARLEKLESKIGKLTEAERQFWREELEAEISEYNDIKRKQARAEKLAAEVGKMSAEERQTRIDELTSEIRQYRDIKGLQGRLAYWEETIGKMSAEERQTKISELATAVERYRTLNNKMRQLDKWETKFGKLSVEERMARIAAIQKEIKGYAEYNSTLRKYIKESRDTRKLVEKEIELQLEINKLKGNVALSDFTQFAIAEAKTTKELMDAREMALREIALQTPLDVFDVLEWARYGAMLSGPLSNARNIVSNTINFTVGQTVVLESSLFEKLIPQERRVSAVINPASAKDRALLKFAEQQYDDAITELKTGHKVEQAAAIINRYKSTGNKALDFALKDFWQKPMEWGDSPFLYKSFQLAYAQACKARGIDPHTATLEQLNNIRDYAIKAAQEATFRRAADAATALSGIERKAKAMMQDPNAKFSKKLGGATMYAFVGGIAPFKNVPANILRQGVEFSPVGLMSATAKAFKNRGNVDGKMIQDMCKGLTGTGIAVLGVYLASLGLLHTEDDDDYNKYLGKLGHRSFSIDIGKFNINLSWIGPVAIPLFVGAAIYEMFEDGFEPKEIFNVVTAIAQPIIDTTVLSGVNEWVETIQFNGIQGALADPVASYFSSFSPALLSAINKTFVDPKRRSLATTKSSGGAESVVKYALNSVFARTPGLSYNLPVYVDHWGREEDTGNLAKRIWDNWFDLANIKKTTETNVDREIQRLYEYKVGGMTFARKNVVPPVDYIKTIEGKDKNGNATAKALTDDEMVEYSRIRGTTALETVGSVIDDSRYSGLDDDTKAAAIATSYEYAKKVAKMEIADETSITYEEKNWILKARYSFGGLSVDDVILCRTVISQAGAGDKKAKLQALRNAGLGNIASDYYEYYESSKKSVERQYKKYIEQCDLENYVAPEKE